MAFTRHALKAARWSAVAIIAWIAFSILSRIIIEVVSIHPPPPLSSVTAQTFRFENYDDATGNQLSDVTAALKKLFPLGTPKSYVDTILVQQDGALEDDRDLKDKSEVYYFHAGTKRFTLCQPGWSIYAKYDSALKLSWLSVIGPCVGP